MSNVLRQTWCLGKGFHLKDVSARWLTKAQVEEDRWLCWCVWLVCRCFIDDSFTAYCLKCLRLYCNNDVGLVCVSLGLTLVVHYRLTSSIKEARLALDAVAPPYRLQTTSLVM